MNVVFQTVLDHELNFIAVRHTDDFPATIDAHIDDAAVLVIQKCDDLLFQTLCQFAFVFNAVVFCHGMPLFFSVNNRISF